MSTKTLLDRLTLKVSSGWSRSTGKRPLIRYIEMGQDLLINTLGSRRIWRGTDNKGFPPYLITVDETYTYEIKAANLSSAAITLSLNGTTYDVLADTVRRIFIDVTDSGYDDTISWMSEPALYADLNPYSTATSRLYISEIGVESMPALGSANPTVTFPFNPGANAEKFFCEFYWRPPRLVSESIPLVIPDEFEQALEDYVVACVQESENGAPSQFMQKFNDYWKIEFKKKFKPAAQTNNNRVILRPC